MEGMKAIEDDRETAGHVRPARQMIHILESVENQETEGNHSKITHIRLN